MYAIDELPSFVCKLLFLQYNVPRINFFYFVCKLVFIVYVYIYMCVCASPCRPYVSSFAVLIRVTHIGACHDKDLDLNF